jgi:hypothetical protein
MADAPSKDILGDPLHEVTRKERRTLLGVSVLGFLVAKTGLIPTKISALGIEFDRTNQQTLLVAFAVVTAYFTVAFFTYALADFLAWLKAIGEYQHGHYVEEEVAGRERARGMSEPSMMPVSAFTIPWVGILSGRVSFIRMVFEFVIPVFVGLYTILVLWIAVGRV